jgi:predicted dehydrogenase
VNEVRLGLIGAGRWGRVYIKTIREMDGIRLSRLCSSNPESRALVDGACHMTEDWRSLLAGGDIDGVIIATPPSLHCEMTLAALRAGIPVMVEKPLTMDLSQALRIQEAAAQSDVLVLVDHTQLFQPAWSGLKDMAKRHGPVRCIRSVAGKWGPFQEDRPVLWDFGAHDVALCLDLIGESPLEVKAELQEMRETREGRGEEVLVRIGFTGDLDAQVVVGNLFHEKQRRFVVYLDKLVLVMDDMKSEKLVAYSRNEDEFLWKDDTSARSGMSVPVAQTLPLTVAVDTFVRGIRGERSPAFGVRLGVDVVRTLSIAEASLGRIGRN